MKMRRFKVMRLESLKKINNMTLFIFSVWAILSRFKDTMQWKKARELVLLKRRITFSLKKVFPPYIRTTFEDTSSQLDTQRTEFTGAICNFSV